MPNHEPPVTHLSDYPSPIAAWLRNPLKHHRYHELDSLRAIAALGVVCWHYVNAYGTAPLGHVLAPFYARGLLMVDFFFSLSGFVLARAFWTDSRSREFGQNTWARVARLYPLHLAMLVITAVLQWYLVNSLRSAPYIYTNNDAYHFVLNLLLVHNSGLQQGASFDAPSWSISTEFLVNIAFFALILLPRRLAGASMACLGFAALAGMAIHGMMRAGNLLIVFDGGLVRTVAGFFVGVALFKLHRRVADAGHRILWDLIAALSTVSVLAYLAMPAAWSNHGDMLTSFVGFPVLIFSVIRSGIVQSILRVRPLVYLGEISYSIYLVHFPIQLALQVFSTATGTHIAFDSRLTLLSFFALVVALASMTYRWIEIPGQRWLMSLSHRHQPGLVSAQ